MAKHEQDDPVRKAFNTLEHVYGRLSGAKVQESNKHPLGDPQRVEHDLSEMDKERLALLRSKLQMEIAEKINTTLVEASQSSDRLGRKVFWLNIVVAVFTLVLAISAVIELTQ